MPKIRRYVTYTFPFLAEYTNDYKKTEFTLQCGYTSGEKGKIEFNLAYILNNDLLNELIADGKITVSVKIVCTAVGFSVVEKFRRGYNTLRLKYDSMLFDGDVNFTAYLVSNEEFVLNNDDLSEKWAGEEAVVMENNVIGESNERTITITHLKSGTRKSIFKFTVGRSMDENDSYSISLDQNECIVFKLPKGQKRLFDDLKDKKREFIYSTYIAYALADIFRQMINYPNEDGEDIDNDFNVKHKNKRWYRVIEDNYSKAFNGKDPKNPDEAIAPLEAAQLIIDKFALQNVLTFAKFAKR